MRIASSAYDVGCQAGMSQVKPVASEIVALARSACIAAFICAIAENDDFAWGWIVENAHILVVDKIFVCGAWFVAPAHAVSAIAFVYCVDVEIAWRIVRTGERIADGAR